MTLREMPDTSVVMFLSRSFFGWYDRLAQKASYLYYTSRIHRLLEEFQEKTKISFRYSFLGRIAETEQTTTEIMLVLNNSRAVQYVLNSCKRWKIKIIQYLRNSLTLSLTKDTEEQLHFSPLRITGIIVIIAVVVNLVLASVLQRQINLLGWLMRGLFLLVAAGGLFCKTDWARVKENSVFLSKIWQERFILTRASTLFSAVQTTLSEVKEFLIQPVEREAVSQVTEKKIKVLRIIARLNIGGPAIHTILLTEGLDKSKFESVLVTGTPEESEGNMAYLAEEKDVQPIIIPELGWALNPRNDFIAFWKILNLIRKEKPDIIHTHTAKAGTLGRLAGLLYKFTRNLSLTRLGELLNAVDESPSTGYRLKLIHTFHGHVLHSYFSKIKSVFFIWIERLLAQFSTKIIAVSENLKKELSELKIARPEKIISVPLGLELERYLNIESNITEVKDYKSIGIIGRLVPVKNHKMFLEVARRVKTLDSAQNMKFIIVGDGEMRGELERYAQELGLGNKVRFVGWRRDLKEIYANLDIVALTSLNEGTPVSVIEAMAAGLPILATDVGGVKDLLGFISEQIGNFRIAKRGILVESGDVDTFAGALIYLSKNAKVAQEMGKQGREFVKTHCSREILIHNIENLYNQILSSN